MSETPDGSTLGNPIPEQLPRPGGFEDEALRSRPEVAGELRAAQEGWLERRGLLEDAPRLTMTRREFDLLRDVGRGDGGDTSLFLIGKTRESYGIPSSAQYVSVDIAPSDASMPHATKLVAVGEEDFGTAIDEGRIEEPEGIPRITMNEREFGLFGIVGMDGTTTPHLVEYARDLCGISQDDQYTPQYALIDIESEDPSLPSTPLLVDVTEADFGTTIDIETIVKDFQSPDSNPQDPQTPELPGGAYRTVDITNALAESWQGLQTFATGLMSGITVDPLSSHYGDIGVRAGGLADGQKDAYVRTTSPFTESVKLTLAFPSQYDSVCIVRGQKREAANGKAGMAQIENPAEVLKIKGESLRELQRIYQDLYHEPDFALTETQRRERDAMFNDHLAGLVSETTRKNRAIEQARQDDKYHTPQLRARQLPR